MKNSKLRILCFIFLMATAFGDVYSQVIAEGYYEGVYIKYGKHLIQASLNEDSINNVSYMNNVESFLDAINAEIDTIYAISRIWHSSGIYVMTIIKLLNDTMDALDYIPVIQNGGFFRYVQPCQVPEELGSFPHPNDVRFSDQTYLYQERGPGDPNHDIDAEKAWTNFSSVGSVETQTNHMHQYVLAYCKQVSPDATGKNKFL